MKSILISINPQHAVNILNGSKTLELRKSVPKDFVGWVYMYVTKGKPFLNLHASWFIDGEDFIIVTSLDEEPKNYKHHFYGFSANGKVVARWWFDGYETLEYHKKNDVLMWDDNYYYYINDGVYNNVECILDKLQLTHQQVLDYGNIKDLYAWHISKLEIFDKPMGLERFIGATQWSKSEDGSEMTAYNLTKAPQSWQYVWVKEKL